MQHIIEALVKDIAEQLRPMVREMVCQELVNAAPDVEAIAENIDLSKLVEHLSMSEIAGELTDSQLTEIAGDIDLSDLAGEIDPDKLAENLDINEAIRDFFQNNTFSIRA